MDMIITTIEENKDEGEDDDEDEDEDEGYYENFPYLFTAWSPISFLSLFLFDHQLIIRPLYIPTLSP